MEVVEVNLTKSTSLLHFYESNLTLISTMSKILYLGIINIFHKFHIVTINEALRYNGIRISELCYFISPYLKQNRILRFILLPSSSCTFHRWDWYHLRLSFRSTVNIPRFPCTSYSSICYIHPNRWMCNWWSWFLILVCISFSWMRRSTSMMTTTMLRNIPLFLNKLPLFIRLN